MEGLSWFHPYDIAPDGRFLINCGDAPPPNPVVMWNWR